MPGGWRPRIALISALTITAPSPANALPCTPEQMAAAVRDTATSARARVPGPQPTVAQGSPPPNVPQAIRPDTEITRALDAAVAGESTAPQSGEGLGAAIYDHYENRRTLTAGTQTAVATREGRLRVAGLEPGANDTQAVFRPATGDPVQFQSMGRAGTWYNTDFGTGSMTRLLRRMQQGETVRLYKVYLPIPPESIASELPAIVAASRRLGAEGMKVAMNADGLARPDRMDIYFATPEQATRFANEMADRYRAAGMTGDRVPFSRQVGNTLVSMGVDEYGPSAQRSWRQRVSSALGEALAEGGPCHGNPTDSCLGPALRARNIDVQQYFDSRDIAAVQAEEARITAERGVGTADTLPPPAPR